MNQTQAYLRLVQLYETIPANGAEGILARQIPDQEFQEWMDAYWAKDVLELFRLERRQSFQKFVELLLIQSGAIFDASRFAKPCEVSRTTIMNYLNVLENTYAAHVIRPLLTCRSGKSMAR